MLGGSCVQEKHLCVSPTTARKIRTLRGHAACGPHAEQADISCILQSLRTKQQPVTAADAFKAHNGRLNRGPRTSALTLRSVRSGGEGRSTARPAPSLFVSHFQDRP